MRPRAVSVDMLSRVGTRFHHTSFGEGRVTSVKGGVIVATFQREEKRLSLNHLPPLVERGMISVMSAPLVHEDPMFVEGNRVHLRGVLENEMLETLSVPMAKEQLLELQKNYKRSVGTDTRERRPYRPHVEEIGRTQRIASVLTSSPYLAFLYRVSPRSQKTYQDAKRGTLESVRAFLDLTPQEVASSPAYRGKNWRALLERIEEVGSWI